MKAIIPAAGHGTRFYPLAKSIPKEMLPIGNKPAIQHIVEEAVAAGAEEVIIVTSPDKPALMQYFTPNSALQKRLLNRPEQSAAIEHLDRLSKKVRFVFQYEQSGLGHAVLQAAPMVEHEKEPVMILLGDALVQSTLPCASEMAEISRKLGGISVVGLEQVPREKVSRYGIVDGEKTGDNTVWKLRRLVEKPPLEEAPSDLAIAGRYLLDPRIFLYLKQEKKGQGGEVQLTDAIQCLLADKTIYGYCYPGKRFDIGSPDGYLEALVGFSSKVLKC
jgi:UTP--glucose-1-phosphate uridylyltransferase